MKLPLEIPIKAAFLQQSITWPGHPAEKTLTEAKMPGLKMTLQKEGLIIEHKGELNIVPFPNITNCVVDIEKLDLK